MSKPRIGIILSTTREGRFADHAAGWIEGLASARGDLDFEVIDLRDHPLPFFDETASPAFKASERPEVQAWNALIGRLDGFVFVTAEYNRSVPAVLKNALDYSYHEWNRKPAAFLGYGPVGAARAVEHLRLITVELQMAPTRFGVHVTMDPYLAVAQGKKTLGDFDFLNAAAKAMLDDLSWWTHTLRAARAAEREAA